MSQQLNDGNLEKLGMGKSGAGLDILLDFIVYMALEDITFFRFLDFEEQKDPCESLFSWIDYEYLNPKGRKARGWEAVKNQLCKAIGKPLKEALTTWAKREL